MDSLGGILINGLLGNPILAKFNLFVQVIIEDITPTPTPTPTPTQVPNSIAAGGAYSENERLVKVTIIYKGVEHTSIHKINNKTLKISINILKGITYIKDAAISIVVAIRKSINNIRVSINGNGHRNR